MKNKPILIVTGEPKSIFFEIFFKSIKSNRFKSPLILICNIHDFRKQIKKFNYKKKFKILSIDNLKKMNLTISN